MEDIAQHKAIVAGLEYASGRYPNDDDLAEELSLRRDELSRKEIDLKMLKHSVHPKK